MDPSPHSRKRPKSTKDDYEELDVIGTGTFATCRKVRRKIDGKVLVWKEIKYGNMSEREKEMLVSEVNILREFRHPHIVKYHDRIIERSSAMIYIVMEYCEGGDLATVIRHHRRHRRFIAEDFVWKMLGQIASAILACHHRSEGSAVMHRDLKPANIFLDADNNAKLGDFGLARVMTAGQGAGLAHTYVGTPYYMSPEQVSGRGYNEQSDIWSLGCLVYELAALVPPFDASSQQELVGKIMRGSFPPIPSQYSAQLEHAIRSMLRQRPEDRPSIEDICKLPQVQHHLPPTTNSSQRSQSDGDSSHKSSLEVERTAFMKEVEAIRQELEARKAELDQREAAVAAREKQLEMREKHIDQRAAMLERHRARTEGLLAEAIERRLSDISFESASSAENRASGSASGSNHPSRRNLSLASKPGTPAEASPAALSDRMTFRRLSRRKSSSSSETEPSSATSNSGASGAYVKPTATPPLVASRNRGQSPLPDPSSVEDNEADWQLLPSSVENRAGDDSRDDVEDLRHEHRRLRGRVQVFQDAETFPSDVSDSVPRQRIQPSPRQSSRRQSTGSSHVLPTHAASPSVKERRGLSAVTNLRSPNLIDARRGKLGQLFHTPLSRFGDAATTTDASRRSSDQHLTSPAQYDTSQHSEYLY